MIFTNYLNQRLRAALKADVAISKAKTKQNNKLQQALVANSKQAVEQAAASVDLLPL